jgi:hypothetical protein
MYTVVLFVRSIFSTTRYCAISEYVRNIIDYFYISVHATEQNGLEPIFYGYIL